MYEMVVVPAVIPVTTPEREPTVPTERLPLLQVPPAVALVSVILLPAHTVAVPAIGDNGLFRITDTVAEP